VAQLSANRPLKWIECAKSRVFAWYVCSFELTHNHRRCNHIPAAQNPSSPCLSLAATRDSSFRKFQHAPNACARARSVKQGELASTHALPSGSTCSWRASPMTCPSARLNNCRPGPPVSSFCRPSKIGTFPHLHTGCETVCFRFLGR
jgi:hypothetical protein